MKIGLVKEIKIGEARVGMTPFNVSELVSLNNEVVVEKNAGVGSGFFDKEYIDAGAKIVNKDQAWDVDLLVKVKEPQESEYKYFKEGLIIWGFLHLAASKKCVEKMIETKTTAIAGETISKNGVLKLLKPMSAIAGRRAVFMGAYYLEKQHQGQGILLSGIDGIDAGTVVILGGGNASENACDMALGINANVVILELSEDRIKYLKNKYNSKNVQVLVSNEENLREQIKIADLFISTILIPGAKPPKIVKEDMVKTMKPGSVIVDISIDQGGTVQSIDKYTTHDSPIFIKHDIIHYAVPNMPGATPRTATIALANGNLEYLKEIVNKGLKTAINDKIELSSGINIYQGNITYENLAKTLELNYTTLGDLL